MNKIFNLKQLPLKMWRDGIFQGSKGEEDPYLHFESAIPDRGEFVGYWSDGQFLKLFRDRIGGRNLYYSQLGDNVYVSTDLLWVVENSGEGPLINKDYIMEEYLPFQIPFTRSTLYQWVNKVLPGEVVEFNKEIPSCYQRYWKLFFEEEKFDPLDLHDLIIDSVNFRKRIVEDIIKNLSTSKGFTSYCSGGIDSSSITLLSQPKEFYSGYYLQEAYNELNYLSSLREIAGGINFVKIDEQRFNQFLSHLPRVMPDPIGGLGVIPQLIVALEAFRGGYHYAFTGEGGDEIFYGYPWNTLILEVAKSVRGLTRDRYMIRWDDMIVRFLEKAFPPMITTLIEKGLEGDLLWEWDKTEPVENNLLRFNIEIGLPAILTVDERVGIYSGVMPVSPLIDHNIIEYVASINPEERSRIPKGLLREALKGILPEKIRLRYDKMGFPVPYRQWKWDIILPLLTSLGNRGLVPFFNPENYRTMDREAWALVNLELICRMLEKED